ncbi:MAG: PepSY domain-containing protein [Bacillota bacterium]|nr:PepSY domain-containing protein [Bacillota bacterium]
MNWKSFILGASIGLVGGYAVREAISQKAHVPAEKVLQNMKNQFKQNGPISGSWIQMVAEPYKKNQLNYSIYRGGITRTVNGENEQYEFIADASTGTILDVYPFTSKI